VTFTKRPSAEDAIKNVFTTLVVKGKKLNVVWCKKIDEKIELKEKPFMRQHEHNLVPCFDFD